MTELYVDEQTRIFRYEVPVDDKWHEISTGSDVLHVDCVRTPYVVEFWAGAGEGIVREYRAFGTGQPLPGGVVYEGSVVAARGAAMPLVWHLVSRVSRDPAVTS